LKVRTRKIRFWEKKRSEKSEKRKLVEFKIQPIYGKGGTNLL